MGMGIALSLILFCVGFGILMLMARRAFTRQFGQDTVVVERESDGATSMSIIDVEKLPHFDFKATDKGSSSPVDCAVCLENFKVGDKCRLLPLCKHSFHAQCVDSWVSRTPICPICRTGVDHGKSNQSDHFSDAGTELGQTQITERINGRDIESSHLRDVEDDRTDNQAARVGNQLTQ